MSGSPAIVSVVMPAYYASVILALQLHFLLQLEMRALRGGLMSAAPKGPCDDVCALNAALCKPVGDTADFLNRPADKSRLVSVCELPA